MIVLNSCLVDSPRLVREQDEGTIVEKVHNNLLTCLIIWNICIVVTPQQPMMPTMLIWTIATFVDIRSCPSRPRAV